MIIELLKEYSGIALAMGVAGIGLAIFFDGRKK